MEPSEPSTASTGSRLAALGRWLAQAPAAAWWMTALYCAAGLWLAFQSANLDDEGLLTFGYARSMGSAFVPTLFFLKVKPVLALFYAPFAHFGLSPFLVAHVAVASLSIWLCCDIARRLGHQRPNLAGLLCMASPVGLWIAATGVSNTDGIAVVALSIWATVRGKHGLALLVAGLGALVRYEVAVVLALPALFSLYQARQRPQQLWPVLLIPAYFLGGAIYHHDWRWFLDYPPNIPAPMPGTDLHTAGFARNNVGTLLAAIALCLPATLPALLMNPRGTDRVQRVLHFAWLGFLALYVVAYLRLLPLGPLFVLGFADRYMLAALPLVALSGSYVLGRLDQPQPSQASVWAVCFVIIAGAAAVVSRHVAGLWVAAPVAVGVMVARARWSFRGLGVGVSVGALLCVPFGLFLHQRPAAREHERDAVALLDEHADAARVFTNLHTLPAYLERIGYAAPHPPKYILQVDQKYELDLLTNPRNGQREVIGRVLPESVFGPVLRPSEDPLRAGDLLLVSRSTQFDLLVERYHLSCETIAKRGDVELLRVR
ncbi:MAG: hypothetical protein AB7S68_12700 [Polyangiaceae bacterium]